VTVAVVGLAIPSLTMPPKVRRRLPRNRRPPRVLQRWPHPVPPPVRRSQVRAAIVPNRGRRCPARGRSRGHLRRGRARARHFVFARVRSGHNGRGLGRALLYARGSRFRQRLCVHRRRVPTLDAAARRRNNGNVRAVSRQRRLVRSRMYRRLRLGRVELGFVLSRSSHGRRLHLHRIALQPPHRQAAPRRLDGDL